jgi:predicted DNA-binding WGR domain protein
MVRIDPEKKMNRWYSVAVQPTLLDPWAIICSWGNKRTNYQQVRIFPSESQNMATKTATKIIRRKVRRGYCIVSQDNEDW